MSSELIAAMQEGVAHIRRRSDKAVTLFHHNDADGLTSGAILSRAFGRAGFAVDRVCLEKPYPQVLERVFRRRGRLLVFADFAGRIAPLISDLNRGRNRVLILDHHKAAAATDPTVHNLNGELFGLKGDRDLTASTTCWLFVCLLDPVNRDLAGIATVGAVGDGFFVNGRLAGQNRSVALEAARQGLLAVAGHENGESYTLITPGGPVPCDRLSADLNTLGAAGYYSNGPDMGIRVCLEGATPASDRMLAELKAVQDGHFTREIQRIRAGGLTHTDHIQWFHVQDRFSPMGVKMIGAFCEAYKDTDVFDPGRYIAGFQVIPDPIPGFGRVPLRQVKISMRVSASLTEKIRSGAAPGLDTFLPEATGRLGGFSDACHSLAAATTVAIGKERELIAEMEGILGSTAQLY